MNSASRLLLCAALSLVSSLAVPTTLAAQEEEEGPETTDEFERLVALAAERFNTEEYAAAESALKEAYFIDPRANLLYNIGLTFERRDECAAALAYLSAATRAPDASPELLAIGGEGLADTSACPDYDPDSSGLLIVRSNPSGAEILVGDAPIGASPAMIASLPSGPVRVLARLRGFEPKQEVVELAPGADYAITLELTPSSAPLAKTDGEAGIKTQIPPDDTPDRSSGALRYTSYALIGLGVVGLGVGAYYNWGLIPGIDQERLEIQVAGDPDFEDDLEEPTEAQLRTSRYAELTDDRKDAVGIMIAATAVGAAVALTGIGLYYLSDTDEAAPKVSIAPIRGGAAVGLSARF